MAAERETSALPASGLAVVIALVLGFVAVQELPLDKSRPGKGEKSSDQLIDNQDAEARLWQDPFAASQRHHEELQKLLHPQTRVPPSAWLKDHEKRHRFAALRSEIGTQKSEVTIIGVTVSSAPYAEDLERRQRYRYATLAGLNRAGFAPDNGEHVGYVITRWRDPNEPCPKDIDLLPELIPYEWFSTTEARSAAADGGDAGKRKVLVLWLSEHAFSKRPVESIRALTRCLKLDAAPDRFNVSILGPGGSDTLRTLLEQYKSKPIRPQVRIYSPFATAAVEGLLKGQNGKRIPYCTAAEAASTDDICLLRTTINDDELAKHLVAELEKRGVHSDPQCDGNSQCKPDRIALISEWDTFYGRSLPSAMTKAICGDKFKCNAVLKASYLQGIDGIVPGDVTPTQSNGTPPKPDPKDQTRESYRGERADGRNQYDYLRRLASELKQQSADEADGKLKAIGVLGSDVYDKLLVLQALRPQFPDVQFFTTDLDARLLHPQEFPYARNIIVASAFGLRLREPLQGEIPPFRDSYQTALFFSTLLAVSHDRTAIDQEKLSKLMKPRLFEIGRRSAFGLDRDSYVSADSGCRPGSPLACPTLHPDAPPFVTPQLKSGSLYISAVLLLGVFAAPVYSAYRRRPDRAELDKRMDPIEGDAEAGIRRRISLAVVRKILQRRRARTMVAAALACAALILVLHLIALTVLDRPVNLEPLRFYEGISLWPTEALRLFAGLLAIFLTYWAVLRMDTNHAELSVWFFPKCRAIGLPEFDFNRKSIRRAIWKNLNRSSLQRIFACNLLDGQKFDTPYSHIDAERFWRECAYHNSPAVSTIRTFVATAFFYFGGVSLMIILGFPHTPFRGALSHYADLFAVLLWSTPLLLFLTFYVADATLLCKRFISALIERHTAWPPETREYFGAAHTTPTPNGGISPQASQAATPGNAQEGSDLDEAYDDWIDVQLIAQRTAAVSGLVYYPVIVMMILLFARSTLFDGWHWPPGLIFILSASMTVLIVCYIVLRREAESARSIARSEVSRRLVAATGDGNAGNTVAQLELMLRNIEGIREGAFAPITQQPLVKALLIFFSASGLAVLEYFGVISF